nr:immunoglobulin light chain junction region [Macaca mulatta]
DYSCCSYTATGTFIF